MTRKTSVIKVQVTNLTTADWEVIMAALGFTAHMSNSEKERVQAAKLISKIIVS